jgi:glycosyltransferase involved in cell wall biosynthesis
MRVLQLISSGGYYGAETMVVNLASSLEKLGYSSAVGVFQNSRNPHLEVAERAKRKGLPVILFACKGRLDFKVIKTLRSYIEDNDVRILHTHGYKANLYGLLASSGLSVRTVATCHNWTRATFSLLVYSLIDLLVLRRFHRVVGVSKEIVDKLSDSGVGRERLLMIRNGVEICCSGEQQSQTKCGDDTDIVGPVVGAVGRMVHQKGFHYLLQSAPAILGEFPKTKFLFVGQGPFRPQLERIARDLGIESQVIFTGELLDMRRIYDSMDIFVLPSLNEGMPMTILEAMGAKRPVIATSVGAIPTLVVPGETGLLVEPRDVVGLQNAVIRLLSDRPLRMSLAEKGQTHVMQHYTAQSMALEYSALYQQLSKKMPPDNKLQLVTSQSVALTDSQVKNQGKSQDFPRSQV